MSLVNTENPNSKFKLTECQNMALEILKSKDNVFLTGHAGTGKSYVIRQYQKSLTQPIPVLASTGAAAVLIEGRTFHGYFGLGIMEGGLQRTVKKAIANTRVHARIKKNHTLIIDEVSMIHPDAFEAANRIAQNILSSDAPFGGLRLIVVGDFLQLPPITHVGQSIKWLFETNVWKTLDFKTIYLTQTMRTLSSSFIDVLNAVRIGRVNSEVSTFLESIKKPVTEDFNGTVLFGRRDQAESFNIKKLSQIESDEVVFETEIKVSAKANKTPESLLMLSPLPKFLKLKVGALVMIRKNDPDGKFVNGSLAQVEKILKDEIVINLFSGLKLNLGKEDFHILDSDGKKMATITNFPVSLAWASTIHKSQGASIDRVHVDLRNLWECGQAYVALSRARSPDNIFIEGWSTKSIKANPDAVKFYQELNFES